MALQQQIFIKAPPDQVRDALQKPETFLKCLSGCRSAQAVNEGEIEIAGVVELAFLRRSIRGRIMIKTGDHENRLIFHAIVNGQVEGDALITLEPAENGTMVYYQTTLKVLMTELPQAWQQRFLTMGGFIVNRAVRKLSDDFFKNFAKQFEA